MRRVLKRPAVLVERPTHPLPRHASQARVGRTRNRANTSCVASWLLSMYSSNNAPSASVSNSYENEKCRAPPHEAGWNDSSCACGAASHSASAASAHRKRLNPCRRFDSVWVRRLSPPIETPIGTGQVSHRLSRGGGHPHRRCAMSLVASARVAGAGAAVLTHDRRAQSSGVADDGCGSPSPISPRMSGARGRRADRALAVRLPADARMRAAWSGQCLTLVRARAAVARVMRCVCAR